MKKQAKQKVKTNKYFYSSFWNEDGDITGGLHTIAIQRNGEGFDVYNYSRYNESPTNSWDKYEFNNIDNIINEGKFITGYKID